MRVDARIVVGTVSILAVTSLAAGQGRDARLVDAVKNSDRQVVQTLLVVLDCCMGAKRC